MNEKAYSFACCSFNGRFIFKFGGISEDNSVIHFIEVYDEKEGYWNLVNPNVDLNNQKLFPLATSAAVQITQNEIMVMGGYSEDNEGQKHNRDESKSTYDIPKCLAYICSGGLDNPDKPLTLIMFEKYDKISEISLKDFAQK